MDWTTGKGQDTAYLIKADGTVTAVKPKIGAIFRLEEMQKIVGGYIEVADTSDGRRLVVNEDGKLKGLPLNEKATKLYRHRAYACIVGDVLVAPKRMFGR